jgi:hypothetical protein
MKGHQGQAVYKPTVLKIYLNSDKKQNGHADPVDTLIVESILLIYRRLTAPKNSLLSV